MKKIALSVLLTALLAACASTPAPVVDPNAAKPTATPAANTSDIKTVDTTNTSGSKLDPSLTDPNNILSQRRVYFDFDSFVVKSDYDAMLQAHAKFLVQHRDYKIILQGNTDNRGTAEYNLALGQKRADATAKLLLALGVNEAQIESVSFGEERPLENGDTDEAWERNRRADIVYYGEQSK
ncbi:peptidoglycan-associated lipoprotein Pal [Chitinibacter bivalviorum]|uniref:Peptidoglycan-associated lipoprotein n=1 Tax=Chitinibacter bivalviorum TaxID=2739434 RepID=A0A7H9BK74_9NEIS|nr:peptidoglycan-associated lipoprotein Pal [Chitinibacter bivalviorum]QLG89085.1 peptidoglycan-associated lipoprotein Pal [Chitinibacter bivalviorum]